MKEKNLTRLEKDIMIETTIKKIEFMNKSLKEEKENLITFKPGNLNFH